MQFKSFDIVPHGTKFDFVGKRKIALILSTIVNLAVILWALPQIHGLDYGVDFAGGTEMQVKFDKNVDPGEIRRNIEALGFKDAVVQTYGPESEHGYLVRVGRVALLTPEDAARVIAAVKAKFPVVGSPAFSPEAGDKIDFEFQALPGTAELQAVVEASGVKVREIREEAGLTAGTRSLAVLTQGIQDRLEKELVAKFADARPQVLRVEYVGPAVGRELRNQGFKAILYAMALIAVYVGLRFDFRFSPGVIIAILHDAIITLGYFAVSGREFNLTSVAVILTVVGYSVNDTVVVYDRIRENQGKLKGKKLGDIVNISINETLGRTILTSFATSLSLVGLLIFGVGTIFDFAMAMLVGIVSGTYSTWFIAAPMTIWLEERAEAAKKKRTAGARAA
jgi:preprotein translocase subunit SecF